VAGGVGASLSQGADLDAIVAAVLATGGDLGEIALALRDGGAGPEAFRSLLPQAVAWLAGLAYRHGEPEHLPAAVRTLLEANQDLANTALEGQGSFPVIGGTFDFSRLEGLTELRGRFAPNVMFLNECPNLERLRARLLVNNALRLGGCAALVELPADLKVHGILDISGCVALRIIPATATISAALDASGCSALEGLPDTLEVTGYLDLSGCSSLRRLPEGLSAGGDLNLSDCIALTGLPDRIRTRERLLADGCLSLRSLPPGLEAKKLSLLRCPAWDGILPDDAEVGVIITDDFPDGLSSEAYRHVRRGPR
jgi:hypothetical protein